jgi:hypothetical protein
VRVFTATAGELGKGRAALVALIERIALETGLAIVLTVPQCLHLSTGDFISEKKVSGFCDTAARFEHFCGRKVMNPASTSSSSGIRMRLVMGVVFAGAAILRIRCAWLSMKLFFRKSRRRFPLQGRRAFDIELVRKK